MEKEKSADINIMETELKKRELDLAALHTQINSHFFYNILASIRGIATLGSKELLSEIIEKTVRYLKYSSALTIESDLYNEFRYLRLYLDIHRILTGMPIDLTINCDESIMSVSMQKFLLQPIVENIINHSVSAHTERLVINITVKAYEKDVLILVSDNGKGIEKEKLAHIRSIISNKAAFETENKTFGVGLYNTQQRLGLYYGKRYRLRIFSKSGAGTRVYLPIPNKRRLTDVQYTDN